MELTRSLVEAEAEEYLAVEPLAAVEQEHVDLLPRTFRGGEFGWRDVEWVVQWYFRRHLGAYPDDERRAAEGAFRDNDFEAVADALAAVVAERPLADRLDRLTALSGVDVPVASAFLLFGFPDRYLAVGDRTWRALRAAGELERARPDPLGVDDYLTFHAACRGLADRFGVDAWTLYRALWRLGAEE